jgi:hypothetical protein
MKIRLQGKYRVILSWLLVVLWAVDIRALPQTTRKQEEQREKARAWVHENYKAIVKLISEEGGCAEPKDTKHVLLWVCARVLPGFQNELEYVLSLEKRDDGTAHAQIIRPQGTSIFEQLLKLKMEHPTASSAELTKLVVLETRRSNQQTLPDLQRLGDTFARLQFSPILSDELILDPTTYFIHVHAIWGEQMDLVLYAPDYPEPRRSHPLIEWVERLHHLLSKSDTLSKISN